MEKIERYLDQVCHGIAGPRALRAHIRLELKEHLEEAVARHQGAGLSEEEALGRALEDFGGPEVLRSELEATHGHRLMTVVVDKALQWKEKTMKARWLWTSWAYVAIGLTVGLEVLFLCSVPVFILPKYRQYVNEGWFTDGQSTSGVVTWSINFLETLHTTTDYVLVFLIGGAIIVALFEWRVRGENKSFMRLSAMGTLATGLLVAVVFTAAALCLPFMYLSESTFLENMQQRALVRMQALDERVTALDKDAAATEMSSANNDAHQALGLLGPHPTQDTALFLSHERPTIGEILTKSAAARAAMQEVLAATVNNDPARLKIALQQFHSAYDPLRQLAIVDSPPSTQPR